MEMGEHDEFLDRISKTFYYAKLPSSNCLSLPVTEIAAEIFTDTRNTPTLDRLDVEEANRISRSARVSPCSLVIALIYVERLKDCNPEYLQRVAPSELFLVSLMIATKFLQDENEYDDIHDPDWTMSGKISRKELNKLEKHFLKAINWTVFVDHKDFWRTLHKLEEKLAYKEARKRGWFSYTELNTLLENANVLGIVQTVLGVSSICVAAYTAGLITLLGSFTIASNIPRTLLSLRQQSLSNDILKTADTFLPQEIIEIKLEKTIQNIVLKSELEKAEMYNNQSSSQNNIVVCKYNSTHENQGWKWLVESITPWFICLSTALYYKSNSGNNLNQNNIYITKSRYLIESDPFLRFENVYNTKKKLLVSSLNDYKHNIKINYRDVQSCR